MPRFFVSTAAADKARGTIEIVGEDALHITRSLRMRPGEKLTVCDDCGIEYETEICEISGAENVLLSILSSKSSENEPPYKCTVYQSLVKGDRFDTVLQKSTELGATEIVPVMSSRCMVKLDKEDFLKKVERWQKIVSEAAKQCGRAVIPVVREPVSFSEAVMRASECELPLFCYEGEGTRPISEWIDSVSSPATVSVMVGPEGGYSVEEAEEANNGGMKPTGLGKRILRTETAPLYVLSCLSLSYEL